MKKRLCCIASAMAVLCVCMPAAAQQAASPDALQPGVRVRFTIDSLQYSPADQGPLPRRWQAGVLDSVTATHLWMHSPHMERSVPLNVLEGLQVRRSRGSASAVLGRGTLLGLAIGAAIGGVEYLAISRLDRCDTGPSSTDACDDPPLRFRDYMRTVAVPSAAIGLGASIVLLPSLRDHWAFVRLRRPEVSISAGAR